MFQNQIFASLKDFSSRLKNTIVKIKQIPEKKNSIGNNCDESYKKNSVCFFIIKNTFATINKNIDRAYLSFYWNFAIIGINNILVQITPCNLTN